MKPTYRITEYGSFVATDSIYGYTKLPQKTFNELKQFILMNKDKADDALEIMGISYKKGIGEVITAKNYVGIITMKDGTNIEILPKVCHHTGDNSEENTKKLLVRMLKTLKKSPYKNIQTTNVNIEKMNIFEIFIRMFMISEPDNIEFISDDGVIVKVKFVDLFDVDNSLREILVME